MLVLIGLAKLKGLFLHNMNPDWDPLLKIDGIYYSLKKTRDAFLKK